MFGVLIGQGVDYTAPHMASFHRGHTWLSGSSTKSHASVPHPTEFWVAAVMPQCTDAIKQCEV